MNFICGNAYEETLRQFSLSLYKLYKCPEIQHTRGDYIFYFILFLFYLLLFYLERAAEPLLTSSTALMAEPKPPLTELPASTQHNYTAVRSGQDFYFLSFYFKYYCYQVIGFCRLSKSKRELPILL